MVQRILIYGAGVVGKTLGALWQQHEAFQVVVVNTTMAHAKRSAAFVGTTDYYCAADNIPLNFDFICLGVPDRELEAVVALLRGRLQSKVVLFHLSGLTDITGVASVHPMRAFSCPQRAVDTFTGTYCAVTSGKLSEQQALSKLFKAIGSKVWLLDNGLKSVYHAAASLCSNYSVTLFHAAKKMLLNCGLAEPQAHDLLALLMETTVTNLAKHQDFSSSLSGPLKRGDLGTVAKHQQIMDECGHLGQLHEQLVLLTSTYLQEEQA